MLRTLPWYVIPGLGSAAAIGLLRLARLVRILVIALRAPAIRALGRQLGGPALVVAAMVLVCAAVVTNAESPEPRMVWRIRPAQSPRTSCARCGA